VVENAVAGGALKKRIFFWRSAGEKWGRRKPAGREPGGLAMHGLAQKLVFSKSRSAPAEPAPSCPAAPLSPDREVLLSFGGLIIRRVRFTGNLAGHFDEHLRELPAGSVGRPIPPGVEVIAADGEILRVDRTSCAATTTIRKATKDAIDEEG
jgi:hypothetical protein